MMLHNSLNASETMTDTVQVSLKLIPSPSGGSSVNTQLKENET